MKNTFLVLLAVLLALNTQCQTVKKIAPVAEASVPAGVANPETYLADLMKELTVKWPNNRTINLVFHGHSVPAGYWANSEVHTLESYPYLLLAKVKEAYPHAVVNVITTAIGGEYSEKGAPRLATDVLPHKPDVLFIDYALNDQGIGLERAKAAWEKMIEEALRNNLKVVLVTPSPDKRQNITDPNDRLSLHAQQVRELAAKYHVGLADPYAEFVRIAKEKGSVEEYMSHVNHPNKKGHNLIAEELAKYLVSNK